MSKSDVRVALTEVESTLDDLTDDVAELRARVDALPDDAPPPAPQILSATVTPSTLPFGGGQVTISAATLDATELLLDGQVIAAPLPWTVECLTTRTFVLTARGAGGEASVDLPVTVAAAPPATNVVPTVRPVNLRRVLVAPGFYFGDRYDRFQHPLIVSGATARLTATTRDLEGGGARIAFGFSAPLSLRFNGEVVDTTVTVATDNAVAFDVDLTGKRGWYKTDIYGLPVGWDQLEYFVFVDDGSGIVPTEMPVCIASYGLMHPYPVSGQPAAYVHVSAMVPAQFAPVTQPLVPMRDPPSFATDPRRDQLVQVQLAVCRQDDKYRTTLARDTVRSTANRQDYFWPEMYEDRPRFHMLDGPRGHGTVVSPTHIEVGRFTFPDGQDPHGPRNVYFCEPRRVCVMRPDGTVITLAGERHREPPTYWDELPQDVELVGDWSAIPDGEPRNFRGLWGMAWDHRTTETDTAAAPIPAEGNLRPHSGPGVTSFVTDMRHNRVLQLRADPRSHLTPRKVTPFWSGLEPWDNVECGDRSGVLAVSVRLENRVVGLSMDDASVLWQFNTPNPEGLYFQDGWLYYASKTTKQVRKRNLATNEDLLAVDLTRYIDNNSMYVKLAVSDGTFGPRGMTGTVTWSNNGYGYPHLFRPNGSEIGGWLWAGTTRVGGAWVGSGDPAPGYPTAVALAFGRMVYGTTQEGMMQMRRATTEVPLPAAYFVGQRQWYERGYQLTHGHRGFGFYGLPLPWGVTPEIDAFLQGNGHIRT